MRPSPPHTPHDSAGIGAANRRHHWGGLYANPPRCARPIWEITARSETAWSAGRVGPKLASDACALDAAFGGGAGVAAGRAVVVVVARVRALPTRAGVGCSAQREPARAAALAVRADLAGWALG